MFYLTNQKSSVVIFIGNQIPRLDLSGERLEFEVLLK